MLKVVKYSELGPFEGQMLAVAQSTAAMSVDPSTKVGCAICTKLDGDKADVSAGFNQFLALAAPEEASRELRYERVIHAEEAALLATGDRAAGGLVACTHEPCFECWKMLAFVGPAQIIFVRTSDDRRERWGCEKGRELFMFEQPKCTILEVVSE